MGILATAISQRNQLPLDDARPWRDAGLLRSTAAGVSVDEEKSLTYSAIFRAVDLLSSHVGMLPAHIFERVDNRTTRKAAGLAVYDVIHRRANDLTPAYLWRKVAMAHTLLWGNHYSEIEYDRSGRVLALWPLRPDRMQRIERRGGNLIYHYRLPNGGVEPIPDWAMFHWRGFSLDGLLGMSVIGLARESIALGLATQTFGAKFFGNDARPAAVLEYPGVLSDKAQKKISDSWTEKFGGLDRSWRMAILEEGMTYHAIGVPPEDAQFLQTRKFQISDVARWYGVPVHKLAEMDRATFSNIEHQTIEYVQDSLQPWATNFEQSVDLQLLTTQERQRHFTRLLIDAMLRGDIPARHQAYQSGLQNGYYSINDVRELENMNPVEHGDQHRVPLNMAPLGSQPATGDEAGDEANDVRARTPDREARSRRSGQRRHALRADFVGVYADVIGRILRREANDVGNRARSMLGNGADPDPFVAWLDQFYADHQEFVIRQVEPVANSYGRQVARMAADEVQAGSVPEDRLTGFLAAYLETYAARHSHIQAARVRKLVEAEADPDELLPAIDAEMELWRDEPRARGMADKEATRTNNAVAVFVYGVAGVTIKRWLAFGESCPYCTALNGRAVGLQFDFLAAGEAFFPDGAETPLVNSYSVGHPPAHGGCDCMIIAG